MQQWDQRALLPTWEVVGWKRELSARAPWLMTVLYTSRTHVSDLGGSLFGSIKAAAFRTCLLCTCTAALLARMTDGTRERSCEFWAHLPEWPCLAYTGTPSALTNDERSHLQSIIGDARFIRYTPMSLCQVTDELQLFRKVGVIWSGVTCVTSAISERNDHRAAVEGVHVQGNPPQAPVPAGQPPPPRVCRAFAHIRLPKDAGCITVMTVYGAIAICVHRYTKDRGRGVDALADAKYWAGNTHFDWQSVAPSGMDFCPSEHYAEAIPATIRHRTSCAARGAAWILDVCGRFYGAVAFADKREDMERAGAVAGAIVRVCFFKCQERSMGECADVAALARNAAWRVMAKLTGVRASVW